MARHGEDGSGPGEEFLMANRVRRQALVSALAALVVVLAATATTRSQQAMPPDPNGPLWGNSIPLWGGEGTFANQYFSGMNRPSLPRRATGPRSSWPTAAGW